MNCIEILEKLVARESTNPGVLEEGVAEDILALLKDAVSELSGTVEKVEVEAHRPILRVLLPGERKECFSFICHMDTVPIGLHWEKNPFGEWEGSRLYGRGSCDMKGGTAAAISAFLQILAMAKKEKQKPKVSLQMVFTSDEEGDMKGVEKAIQEGWLDKNTLLMDTEPTDGTIQTAHKGRFWYEWQFHGKAAHASEPETGIDAILSMAMAIPEAKKGVDALEKDSFLGDSKICFGQCSGGIHPYQVPAEAKVSVDMRLVPPYTAETGKEILEKAVEKVQKLYPGLQSTILITGNRPAIPHYEESLLLAKCKKAIEAAGYQKAKVCPFPGYTDTAVVAGKCDNHTTLSYGPGSLDMAHQRDEYVEKDDVFRCEKVYFELLRDFYMNGI